MNCVLSDRWNIPSSFLDHISIFIFHFFFIILRILDSLSCQYWKTSNLYTCCFISTIIIIIIIIVIITIIIIIIMAIIIIVIAIVIIIIILILIIIIIITIIIIIIIIIIITHYFSLKKYAVLYQDFSQDFGYFGPLLPSWTPPKLNWSKVLVPGLRMCHQMPEIYGLRYRNMCMDFYHGIFFVASWIHYISPDGLVKQNPCLWLAALCLDWLSGMI